MNTTPSYNIKIDTEKYTNFRRSLHQIPETGYKEVLTKQAILNQVKNMKNSEKIKLTEVGETGFWIDLKGEDTKRSLPQSRCLAFRTDLDALPLEENTEVPWKSKHPKRAHSCGHDGHMAIVTSFMEYTLCVADKLPQNLTVRFLFQPAEEALGGGEYMVKMNCLQGVDEIYGLHNLTLFNLGEIGLVPNAIMASNTNFKITIHGKGGHGSVPHMSNSPIITGSSIVTELNKIISINVDSKERAALSIGSFVSGEAPNVIPESAVLRGTYRSLSKEVRNLIAERIEKICDSVSSLNNCKSDVEITDTALVTFNDSSLTKEVEKAVEKSGLKLMTENLPVLAAEDFSYFQDKIPGVFFMLGCRDEEHKSYLHHPEYDFNDKAIPYGVEVFLRILEIRTGCNLV